MGDHIIPPATPPIVALRVLARIRGHEVVPPAGGLDWQWIELDNVLRDTGSAGRNGERHGWPAFSFVEREARWVEPQLTEHFTSVVRSAVQCAQRAQNRIPFGIVHVPALLDDGRGGGRPEQIADGDSAPRSQIDDAASGRPPGPVIRCLDVDPVFI